MKNSPPSRHRNCPHLVQTGIHITDRARACVCVCACVRAYVCLCVCVRACARAHVLSSRLHKYEVKPASFSSLRNMILTLTIPGAYTEVCHLWFSLWLQSPVVADDWAELSVVGCGDFFFFERERERERETPLFAGTQHRSLHQSAVTTSRVVGFGPRIDMGNCAGRNKRW